MTSYATTAQLAQYSLGSLALGGSISTADQQAELDAASLEMDGYLAAQYSLPLTSWGTTLAVHVCNVAAYRLLGRRGYRAGGVDQGFRERYEDAIKWATKIAQGTLSPPDIVDATPGIRDGGPATTTGMNGNTVGGTAVPSVLNPSVTSGTGSRPYPYIGNPPGSRGW